MTETEKKKETQTDRRTEGEIMTPCFACLKSFQNNCLSLGRRLSLFLPPGVPHVEPEGLPPLAFPSLPYPSCLASGEPAFLLPREHGLICFHTSIRSLCVQCGPLFYGVSLERHTSLTHKSYERPCARPAAISLAGPAAPRLARCMGAY